MIICHDWSMEGYSVTDYGRTVTLHLIRNDPGPPIARLNTIFSGVALYHFVHTQGTIILDIMETLIENIFEEYGARITRKPDPVAQPPWTDGSLLPLSRGSLLRGSGASAEQWLNHRKANQLDLKSGAVSAKRSPAGSRAAPS